MSQNPKTPKPQNPICLQYPSSQFVYWIDYQLVLSSQAHIKVYRRSTFQEFIPISVIIISPTTKKGTAIRYFYGFLTKGSIP